MFETLKRLIFAHQYKRAIKRAKDLAELTGFRYYVIYLNGGLKVVPKKVIKELIYKGRFKKGTKIQDIEKRALFITD